jgi:hypothetical protein
MANSNDMRESQWVEERLRALEATGDFQPDVVRAHVRLRERADGATTRRRRAWFAVATGCLALVLLPWPRAAAQHLWDRIVLGRVEVVQVIRADLPEHITATFAMEARPFERETVRDATEAERLAGFRPELPPPGVLDGTPTLSVVRRLTLATSPLRIADIERALAAAGVSDINVPGEWEGTILVAEGGPLVVAEYDGVELMQSAPFRMAAPSGFQFGRFMEIAFRVFGRSATEARALGTKFEANPALVMHFPERDSVRDVPLRWGQGIFVGDPDGPEGICFFWNTSDRIYIVSAEKMSPQAAAVLANSIQ